MLLQRAPTLWSEAVVVVVVMAAVDLQQIGPGKQQQVAEKIAGCTRLRWKAWEHEAGAAEAEVEDNLGYHAREVERKKRRLGDSEKSHAPCEIKLAGLYRHCTAPRCELATGN
jgi:hypothetical protein